MAEAIRYVVVWGCGGHAKPVAYLDDNRPASGSVELRRRIIAPATDATSTGTSGTTRTPTAAPSSQVSEDPDARHAGVIWSDGATNEFPWGSVSEIAPPFPGARGVDGDSMIVDCTVLEGRKWVMEEETRPATP